MNRENANRRSWSIRKPLSIGLAALGALFALVVLWGATFKISGAVIAKGQVQVSASRTAVQHSVGGIVAEIRVENGDTVKSGDVVVRLDDTQLRSDLASVEGELFEILANEARLEAELDDRHELSLNPILQEAAASGPELQTLIARQKQQLDAHYKAIDTQIRLLEEQTTQINDEVLGEEAALDALRQKLVLSEDELASNLKSLDKGIITKSIVTTLQKDVIGTKGEIGRLIAKVAELKGKASEQKLKMHAIPLDAKEKSSDKINQIGQLKQKLLESRRNLKYRLSALEVRSPVSGIVYDSKVLGLRSVIEAAKPIMYIVPDTEPVSVSVNVDAVDIEQVHLGQHASLRFTAFNRRSTPMVGGEVINISADAFKDERTQKLYYQVEVSIVREEVEEINSMTLISGMPVEAFLTTVSRSPASYVVKPIAEYFSRAFRD